jgi:Leucine-rich repeat (LRR) protein
LGIEKAYNLKFLNVSFNMITSINSIVGLKSLRELVMGNNHLTSVKDFGDLTNLVVLDISSNKLIDMDKLVPLKPLTKLKVLCISGNPLCLRLPKYEDAV